MPTPFMHLALAQRLMDDPALPDSARQLIDQHLGPFLLGSIAPDARVSSGLDRVSTHFFEYGPTVDSPVAAMFRRHAALKREAVANDGQAAYVAGYAAHLTMDEVWSTQMLFPVFIDGGAWEASVKERYLALHGLLAWLDRRDRQLIPENYYPALASAEPDHWLPFIGDDALRLWRDTIADQLAPGAQSRTLEVLANRMQMPLEQFIAFINDDARMDALVWANVPHERVAALEEAMYSATRAAVIQYLID